MKSKNIADAIDMLDDDILLHTAEVRMKIKKSKADKICCCGLPVHHMYSRYLAV